MILLVKNINLNLFYLQKDTLKLKNNIKIVKLNFF
jgi:hypothetical protein